MDKEQRLAERAQELREQEEAIAETASQAFSRYTPRERAGRRPWTDATI